MPTRRRFLAASGTALATAAIAPISALSQAKAEAEVSPTEDLMREHGALRRILLIYEHLEPGAAASSAPNLKVIAQAADIIRTFIENYHEKLEENFLFPRFEKAGKLADLTKVLRDQHRIGRGLTADIMQLTSAANLSADQRTRLSSALAAFMRLYRPHAAREDTVLFPALHQLVSAKEFDSLGDQFEDKERELFGKSGFETMVERVAGLEKMLGLYDLAQFSTAAPGPKPPK